MYYEAIFDPTENEIYNEEAQQFAGKLIAIQDGWVINEGPHKGEHCFYVPNSTIGTIPKSDLKDIKSIPVIRWKEILKSMGVET
ncbi:MAG: hypothetical protein HKM93_21025 [Desulfobacteraceae bacterium]|nr:hypothetical protein [Desulfobacteraceae bacterium]